ncbi:Paramyosin [Dirofilaria immitis]|nr:Paramyosin [Dirofilaria immitis]
MSGSLYRSPSAALYKSPSMSAFGLPAAFGSMSVADLGSLTRLEDKIRLLQEDLESERELRNRIERERADLSVQLIALTDRLEDAEGTTDSQIESNRKREAELQNYVNYWKNHN